MYCSDTQAERYYHKTASQMIMKKKKRKEKLLLLISLPCNTAAIIVFELF